MDAYERKLRRKLSGVGIRNAVVYQIESTSGEVVYIGMTNNIRWHMREHYEQGTAKLGETFRRIAGPMPRKAAADREESELRAFVQRHGRPPSRNRTQDGKHPLNLRH